MTPEQRTAIYSVAVALGPLLAAYGLVSEDSWALWLAFFSTLLSSVTAFVNRPTKMPPIE